MKKVKNIKEVQLTNESTRLESLHEEIKEQIKNC